jgi:hypothetical protein
MNNLKEIKIMHILSLLIFLFVCGGNIPMALFGWFITVKFVIPEDWIF